MKLITYERITTAIVAPSTNVGSLKNKSFSLFYLIQVLIRMNLNGFPLKAFKVLVKRITPQSETTVLELSGNVFETKRC